MSTPNFRKYNTNNYCVILDENHFDYADVIEDLRENAFHSLGLFEGNDWSSKIDGRVIAEDYKGCNKYGTELTEVNMKSQLLLIGGYYADATIDFDIIITPIISGYKYRLSEYSDLGEMVDDILADMEGDARYYAEYQEGEWNYGIWKMNKRHVENWLTQLVTNEMERLNKFCEENCDVKLYCRGVFSNGEAVYGKVD